jgi:AcrR family transcriptional regulator
MAPVAGKTRKDVVTQFREAEILQAARQVFARRGFAEASMEEIAQVAGLAKGTLYLYYESKRELYRAAIRAGLLELCEALEQAIEHAPSLSAKLEAYVTTKVAYFDEHRDFFRIYLAEFGHAACGAIDPYFRDLSLRQSRLLEAAIREGTKGGGAKPAAAQEAAHAVSDLTRGVILRRLMGWNSEPVAAKEVAFVVDFAKKALGCR